jgi:hypothetical protein
VYDGINFGCFGSVFGICIYLQSYKGHNMLTLILDPRFKSFDVVKTFVGWEKMILMVVEYDAKLCYFCWWLQLLISIFKSKLWWLDWSSTNWWWWGFHLWGSEHFAWIVNKWIEFVLPFACEAIGFYVTLGLVENPWSTISKCIFGGSIDFGDSWVPYQNWKNFQHSCNFY